MNDVLIVILSQMAIAMMAVSAIKSHVTLMILRLARGTDISNENLINEIRRADK